MKRKLKALGLALVAVLALSAAVASAGQAANHHFTVPTAPAIITAEDHVNTTFEVTAGEHKIECTTTLYEGTVSEATSTEVTVTPTYSGCKVDPPFGPAATIDVNHCAYIFTGATVVEGATEDGRVHFECAKKPKSEENTEITITYSLFGSQCVIHIPPQTPQYGIHYTQTTNATTGKKDVTVNFTVSGIKYKETGGGFCPATYEGNGGTLNGAVTAQAYTEKAVCTALPETGVEGLQGRTTPGAHYNECEEAAQDLELTTT